MESRHPHLRYSRGPTWLDCRLKEKLIAQAGPLNGDRWMLVRIRAFGLDWDTSVHDDYDAMFAALVPWARAYAWKHDPKPYGSAATAKGLRRRPT